MKSNSNNSKTVTPESIALPFTLKNQNPAVADRIAAIKAFLKHNKRFIVITSSVVVLQWILGLDPKFCIINMAWLLV